MNKLARFWKVIIKGLVNSLESLEMPEITEMAENFTEVTKYLTKSKVTLINYGWENLTSKSSKNKIFRRFRVFEYAIWQKNENPEMPEINRKLSK